MPRKWPDDMIHDVIDKYAFEGLSIKDASLKLGIPDKRVASILKSEGFNTTRRDRAFIPDMVKDAIGELFDAGMGHKGIVGWLGYPERAAQVAIEATGRKMRNRGEQQAARMRSSSPEQIAHLVRKAHKARRGQKDSLEAKCKRAKFWESTGWSRGSEYEVELGRMLEERGHALIPQKAIGPYNCDIAAGPVAVEVFGGNWHWHGRHLARTEDRFRYLMDRGYSVLVVAINKSFPLTAAVADYISDSINVLSSNPSAARQYRVVWGAGEFTTGGSQDDDHFSIEPPFTSVRDPASGRYKTIPH